MGIEDNKLKFQFLTVNSKTPSGSPTPLKNDDEKDVSIYNEVKNDTKTQKTDTKTITEADSDLLDEAKKEAEDVKRLEK